MTDDLAAPDSAAGEEDGLSCKMVPSALVVKRACCAAKFSHRHDESVGEDAAGLQVGDQRSQRGVKLAAHGVNVVGP